MIIGENKTREDSRKKERNNMLTSFMGTPLGKMVHFEDVISTITSPSHRWEWMDSVVTQLFAHGSY